MTGEDYDALIEEFMFEVQNIWGPSCLLQFEDFGNANAFRLLKKFRNDYCTFNDDIQGTASVALAGVYSAIRVTGGKLSDQTFVFMGAGSAGIGIAELICLAMSEEENITIEEARKNVWLVDSKGLIFKGRQRLNGLKPLYAHEWDGGEIKQLADVVKAVKATALIGVSGQARVFTEEVCKNMAANADRPIIFPMSNPNSKAEGTAEDCYKWTNNRCIFASGSPWPTLDIELDGFAYQVIPAQGNNAYVFPGIALAIITTGALTVPESLFITAAKVLSTMVTEDMLKQGTIYPLLQDIRKVSFEVACVVASEIYKLGVASTVEPKDIREMIRQNQFDHKNYKSYAQNLYAETETL